MSEKLRHKMIHFEATPPGTVWEAIAERIDADKQYATVSGKINKFETTPPSASWRNIITRLEDDKQYEAVSSKLTQFEVTPPGNIWNALTHRLDDDKQYAVVSERISQFETTPPLQSWDAIAARLDDDKQNAAVATKMTGFDAAPPATAWNHIAEALQENPKEKSTVVHLRKTIYRVAAAAILIGLLIGGWLFTNQKNKGIEVVKNNNAAQPFINKLQEEKSTVVPGPEKTVAAVDHLSAPLHNAKHNPLAAAVAEVEHEPVLKHAQVNGLMAYQEKPIVISSSPILDNDGNIIRDMDVLTTSNYIMVTGPNGQATRISSKFASVIRYLNGSGNDPEEYLDKVIKESDTWKKRFQEWRNKISQAPFIPSSANFLDIIELKELIEEKQ